MKNFVFLSILLLLTACQSSEKRLPAITPIKELAAAEPAAVEPTAVPTPTLLPTPTASEPDPATPTAVPTPTLLPTLTASEPDPATPTAVTPPELLAVADVTSYQLVPIVTSGLTKPVFLTHAFDSRLFVVEQPGTIRLIANGQLQPEPFLDIQNRVGSEANEQGLLSMAFHPHYGENGRFFVNYTNKEGSTVIARFLVNPDDPNQADPASETNLLTIPQPYGNHNGGQIQFGPDGYLYIGMGDGGSANDPLGAGQDLATLLGKLLRLDVDSAEPYAIPSDNPYANDNGRLPEIWAWGLRNPWRFSFDRATGDLFIADVGQNRWEEVNYQPAGVSGVNYGWNTMEATHCRNGESCDTANLQLPVFEYSHDEGGCAITGGYFYRGAQPGLYGNYFAADYCTGQLWALTPGEDGSWGVNTLPTTGFIVSSFGEDAAGELYVLDHRGGVYRLSAN